MPVSKVNLTKEQFIKIRNYLKSKKSEKDSEGCRVAKIKGLYSSFFAQGIDTDFHKDFYESEAESTVFCYTGSLNEIIDWEIDFEFNWLKTEPTRSGWIFDGTLSYQQLLDRIEGIHD